MTLPHDHFLDHHDLAAELGAVVLLTSPLAWVGDFLLRACSSVGIAMLTVVVTWYLRKWLAARDARADALREAARGPYRASPAIAPPNGPSRPSTPPGGPS